MKHLKSKTIIVIIIASFAAYAIYFAARGIEADSFDIEAVSFDEKILASGTLILSDTLDLKASVRGLVVSVSVEEGQNVAEGQILLEMDTKDIDLKLDELSAGIDVVKAQIAENDSLLYPNALESLSQANIRKSRALEDLKNAERLYEAEAISRSQYDDARSLYSLYSSEALIAMNKASALSPNGSTRIQLSAEIDRLSSQVLSLQNERDKHFIRSPVNGLAVEVLASSGEIEESSSTLVKIIREESVLVEIDLDEFYVSSVSLGQKVLVSSAAYGTLKYDGIIDSISSTVDPDTGTVLLRVRMEETPPFLIKNLSVRCEIITGSFENAISIPEKYIYDDEGYFVFVLADGRAERRSIVKAGGNSSRTRIIEGLSAGDVILYSKKLEDGSRVRITGDGSK